MMDDNKMIIRLMALMAIIVFCLSVPRCSVMNTRENTKVAIKAIEMGCRQTVAKPTTTIVWDCTDIEPIIEWDGNEAPKELK